MVKTKRKNNNLESLVKCYKSFIEEAENYERAEKFDINLKEVSSRDIKQLPLLLFGYQKLDNFYLSGLYISKLINSSDDKEFKIHTNYLDFLIDYLGYKNNGKIITIDGNAGNWVGWYMNNGEITIDGNVRDGVGMDMKGGKITVNGNARWRVGSYMQSGSIYLNGDYESLGDHIYGNIYHKGKLIVENGVIIQKNSKKIKF